MNGPFASGARLLLAVALLCSACAPASGDGDHSAAPAQVAANVSSHQHGNAASARQVRLLLEQLLGHHAILMVRLMRGPVDGERAFVSAADGALRQNTGELVDAVSSVYGAPAGAEFDTMWSEHVDLLADYGRARAQDDDGGMAAAREALDGYAARYGEMVSALTEGELPADAVAEGVSAHIHHLLDATDAYAAGDYGAAFDGERTAYAGMFTTGKQLSGAAVSESTGELPAGFDSPPSELRSALGRLLGEHVELAFDATRAVVSGNDAAAAAADALNANTQDIIAALQGALGDDVAREFSRIWSEHIDALVDFSVAVADDDAEAQARARAGLDAFPGALGEVLPALSRGRVTARSVIAALKEHDEQLLQQVTAYAAGDYETSHDLAYSGYEHMFAIANTLADALEGNASATSPREGPATGGGGLSGR